MIESVLTNPKFVNFLLGLARQCIVAAIKKGKELKDKQAEQEAKKIIDRHELAKDIRVKVEQRITASIQTLPATPEQLERVLAFDRDPLLKQKLAKQYATDTISPDSISALFIEQDPQLATVREELTLLADAWLEAMDKLVAEDATLSRCIVIRSQRAIRVDITSLGNGLAKAEFNAAEHDLREQQRHEELKALIAGITAHPSLRNSDDNSSTLPDHLKSEHQKRFDRARQHLLENSVVIAEHEFRGLVQDLESALGKIDDDLLLRSYLNVGSALWEQAKPKEATAWFDKAYKLNPSDWRARRGLAITLMDSDPDAALLLFHSIRIERPDEAEHTCNEAIQLKNHGRLQDAITLLESREFEDDNYYSTLSLAYLDADRFTDAAQAARKALAIDPNSESAQSALAYALGFPYIHRLMRRDSYKLAPTEEEHSQIKEAIRLAEQAALTLRKHGRVYMLVEVLTNLVSFYSASNDCDLAIKTAGEVLVLRPCDATTLTNLWCMQMRTERFDDAVGTAQQLESIGDPVDGWQKRAQALLAADRPREVLAAWDSKKQDRQFQDAPDVVSLVARAFAESNRTHDGLKLLDEALLHKPQQARLLAERGMLLENLGNYAEAKEQLTIAEKCASHGNRGQAVLDCGMFLYRRREWAGAASRFHELGADSIRSPLFTNYVICLFNQGKYRETIALVDGAIEPASAFDEDQYAVAARCHLICGNLARAKELFDALVRRHTPRELQHRKLLASVCWRLDELVEAHDVLLKAVKLKADDVDVLILLSALYTIRGEFPEAFDHAIKATETAPNSVPAHVALVRVGFSCSSQSKPKEEHLEAHFRSLAFLQKHEPKVIQTVSFEPDLHSILDLLKRRAKHVSKVESIYQNKKLPMGFFATQVQLTNYQLWRHLTLHPKYHVRFAYGTTEEQETEKVAADSFTSVSVDLFALFTLQHLNLLWLLPKIFSPIYAHASLLEEVVGEIRELQQHPTQGSIAYIEGRLLSAECSPEEHKATISFLEAIRDFLKSSAIAQPGVLPEIWSEGHWQLLADTCGLPTVAPIIVASQRQTLHYSDDAASRILGKLTCKTQGCCSQALLRIAVARGLLSQDAYQDAVIKLLNSNYAFVSEDSGTLRRVCELSAGKITPLARVLINRVNVPPYNPESCLSILAEFLTFLWLNKLPLGADSRYVWATEIWRTLAKITPPESLLLEFIGKLASLNSMRPATFVGIVNWGLLHVPELQANRQDIYLMMQQTIKTLRRLIPELFPWAPELSRNWGAQGAASEVLRRQGFLKL